MEQTNCGEQPCSSSQDMGIHHKQKQQRVGNVTKSRESDKGATSLRYHTSITLSLYVVDYSLD